MVKLFRTPSFVRKVFPNRIWGFSHSEKKVYLTFDDGPTESLSNWILDELEEKNIKATFFCVGTNAQKYPELMDRIVSSGHRVGNHTMRHEKGISVDREVYLNSIEECALHVKSNLFRPPYGRLYSSWDKEISSKYKIIMWSWLSYDYDDSVPVSLILKKAKEQIQAGDILVLHDNMKVEERLRKLLPELITFLKKDGFSFAVID